MRPIAVLIPHKKFDLSFRDSQQFFRRQQNGQAIRRIKWNGRR